MAARTDKWLSLLAGHSLTARMRCEYYLVSISSQCSDGSSTALPSLADVNTNLKICGLDFKAWKIFAGVSLDPGKPTYVLEPVSSHMAAATLPELYYGVLERHWGLY